MLTSPPYPGVYDYLPMQQLRYAWLDMDPGSDMAGEIGSLDIKVAVTSTVMQQRRDKQRLARFVVREAAV